ncbi:MAG: anaerobic sulfatase-maturation protein [Bacteroidetes bacterium]|nr:anaerobic sulfatase-maturation protein [Bacteroidota bacterium]
MSIKVSSNLPFSLVAKPIGSVCNLNCSYCYYLEKEKLYPHDQQQWAMSEKLLDTYIAQTIYTSRDPVVLFAWHGGEPIMRGMDFFSTVIRLQNKYGAGRVIENSIQTNGTLLTDDWCSFFRDNQFLVGISIDGPEHCHDHYRVYRNGQGSFNKCMKGLELLVKHKAEFNTLSAVNDYNAKYPAEVYRFLKSTGSRYMQFLPVVEWVDPEAKAAELSIQPANSKKNVEVTDWTVDPFDYGNFLVHIFDEWVLKDVGDYFVLTFDCVLANWMGVPPPVCVSAETCGHAGVMEYNGDVYSCDHYVFPQYKLGNIKEKSILTLMNDPSQLRFGHDKRDTLPAFCLKCEFLGLCNGECPKNRIINTPDGEPGLNYLCPGFKKFFKHTRPYFEFMANELQHKRPPSNVKKWASARQVES